MKLIKKNFELIFLLLSFIFFQKILFALDPVEIGKPPQEDVEINLSIIDNLNDGFTDKKIEIKKDIRTKLKKKEKVFIKTNEKEKEKNINIDSINKQIAKIEDNTKIISNEIQIFFSSETAKISENDKNKITNFINKQADKKNLNFKITSYAKTNKNEDISRRLSLDRAINIRSILLNEDIPAKNLVVKSFGDRKNEENKVIIQFEKK